MRTAARTRGSLPVLVCNANHDQLISLNIGSEFLSYRGNGLPGYHDSPGTDANMMVIADSNENNYMLTSIHPELNRTFEISSACRGGAGRGRGRYKLAFEFRYAARR